MQEIRQLVTKCLDKLEFDQVEFSVSHPRDEDHGDYSVNVAMILAKKLNKNPKELAAEIAAKLEANEFVQRVEVAGPGFINFYLKSNFYLAEVTQAVEPQYGKNNSLAGQKTFVEFTDPNPFKEFHIGHLMSNTIGESLSRIFEANGAVVKRANYQGDIGLHVAKSIWGWQRKMSEDGMTVEKLTNESIKARIVYLGVAYAYGATKYEEDEAAKAEMNGLNKVIYDKTDEAVAALYTIGRKWSLEYFETIYARLGTKFDEYFFESEEGPKGLKIVEEGLKKGILELGEEGAVVFKGEQYGLHTRVFRNKLGLPTYEAKELALPTSKYGRWAYDKSYIITANEIDEYFKVLLKVLSLLYPELGAKTTHLSHGMMRLTTGKMSSRTGKVVSGEGLLDELKQVVLEKMGERSFDSAQDKDIIADQIAVGSLKYSVLKQAIGGDITYEPEKMTNMEGDTGPYLQYTYARTQSVLKKASIEPEMTEQIREFNPEEMRILKWIYRYPEVVMEAGEKRAPHIIASYIYELSTRFNTFYNAHQISEDSHRLFLTKVVGNLIKSGLNLLGIQAPAEM